MNATLTTCSFPTNPTLTGPPMSPIPSDLGNLYPSPLLWSFIVFLDDTLFCSIVPRGLLMGLIGRQHPLISELPFPFPSSTISFPLLFLIISLNETSFYCIAPYGLQTPHFQLAGTDLPLFSGVLLASVCYLPSSPGNTPPSFIHPLIMFGEYLFSYLM